MKILKETSSPLLSRKTIEVLIDHPKSKTPNTLAVKKSLSEHLKKPEELIVVSHIYSVFGETCARVIANVYDDIKTLEKIEIKKKKPKAKKEKAKEAAKEAK